MALDSVGQADMLAGILAEAIAKYTPASLLLLACADGNGLDRVEAARTTRIVAVDVNPLYVTEVGRRYRASLPGLELVVATSRRTSSPWPRLTLSPPLRPSSAPT